jgi:hypothetical protein
MEDLEMGYVSEFCASSAGVTAIRRMTTNDLISLLATRRSGSTSDVVLVRLETNGPAYGVDSADATTLTSLGVATRV